MNAHFFQVPHARLIDMLGKAVRYTVNPDICGTLVAVNGDWATIAAPPDAMGLRRKDDALCEHVEIARGGEGLAAMWAEQAAKAAAPICPGCGNEVIEGDRIHPYCARVGDFDTNAY